MLVRLLQLAGASLATASGIAVFLSDAQRGAFGLGLAIVLPPSLLTYAAVLVISRRDPQLGITAVLAGMGLRMAWSIVSVVGLNQRSGPSLTGIRREALAEWTVVAYIITLIFEIGLLVQDLQRSSADPRQHERADSA
jgi:hypothetical protein